MDGQRGERRLCASEAAHAQRHAARRAEREAARRRDEDVVRRNDAELSGLCREAAHGGITRRQFVERGLILGLSATAVGALAAACDAGSDSPAPSPGAEGGALDAPAAGISPMDETKPDEIVFYNWTDYISPEVKRAFQAETGIVVRDAYYNAGEEIFAKLRAGAKGYDVLVASDYMVTIMSRSGLLEPLDMTRLPNFRYVGELFRDPGYDDPARQDGVRYSIPYFYGTTGYSQRLDLVPEPQTSWKPLFDLRFSGQIHMLDDEREALAIALKYLGYSGNTTDPEELQAAADLLIEQKPLVAKYDSVSMKRSMTEGDVPFVLCWDGDYLMALDQLKDRPSQAAKLRFVRPREGYMRWTDALVVPKGNNSRYGAHLFMDYLLDPEAAGRNASWVWYLSPVMPASWRYTDAFALTAKPTDEELARSEQLEDVGDFASAYSDAWRQVKSA